MLLWRNDHSTFLSFLDDSGLHVNSLLLCFCTCRWIQFCDQLTLDWTAILRSLFNRETFLILTVYYGRDVQCVSFSRVQMSKFETFETIHQSFQIFISMKWIWKTEMRKIIIQNFTKKQRLEKKHKKPPNMNTDLSSDDPSDSSCDPLKGTNPYNTSGLN